MLVPQVPRAEQEEAIQEVLLSKSHICRGEVGSGKTLVGVEAALRSGAKFVLVIAPINTFSGWRKAFIRQSGVPINPLVIDSTKQGKLNFETLVLRVPGVYLIGWERFRMFDWSNMPLEFVILDECFVAGTPIATPNGPRAIEDLRAGDVVWGFDHERHVAVESRVKATMSKQSNTVMPNGATANHPYFVHGEGYLPLADLTNADEVYQIVHQEDSPSVRRVQRDLLSEGPAAVLQLQMQRTEPGEKSAPGGTAGQGSQDEAALGGSPGETREGITGDAGLGAEQRGVPSQGQETHDGEQPWIEPGSICACASDKAGTRSDVSTPERGQWYGDDPSREVAIGITGLVHAGGSGDSHGEGQWVPVPLQARRGERTSDDRRGVRWDEPCFVETAGAGQEEDRLPGGSRVDYLTIQEPRDRERFERVREDHRGCYQQVYNIETETGNYFADGVLVHNCHRQQNRHRGTHLMVMTTVKAEYKLALSATPWGNHIQGAWATIRWLWHNNDEVTGKNDSFWNWATAYMTTSLDKYSGKKVDCERQPGTVWASLPSKSYFPSPFQEEPIIHEIECEMSAFQRKIYDRFEQEAVAWLNDRPLVADLPPIMRLRLREIALAVPSIKDGWLRKQDKDTLEWEKVWGEIVYFEEDAKSSKVDNIIEVLNDLYAEKPEPVLIYTHSRKFATMLALRLQAKGFRARQFVGGMSKDEREWKLENFGTEFDVMVATIPTVSEGTDGLQLVSRIEFWVSLDDNRLLNTQAKGRLSRPGQTRPVQRYLFLAPNTVETKQLGKLEADQAQLDSSFQPMEVSA
jgi:hypothetical protein